MAAPNGARLGHEDHVAIPLTARELADEAEALVDSGVSVLHLHVRDSVGRHTLDDSAYREAIHAITSRVSDRLILQVTTEAVGIYRPDEQMALVRALRPPAVSLALRELCPDEASEGVAAAFFRDVLAGGTWPQYILYTPEEVARFERMRRAGVFGEDHPFVLLVLGRKGAGIPGSPEGLQAMLGELGTAAVPWAACCFGSQEAAVMSAAASAGGHVRIGFENNCCLPGGALATNNAQLVRATLAGIDRQPADAGTVRRMFGLSGRLN